MKTRAEYNILDFLKDDSFLRSVLLLTDDDVEFWDNYVLENPAPRSCSTKAITSIHPLVGQEQKWQDNPLMT